MNYSNGSGDEEKGMNLKCLEKLGGIRPGD